MEHEHFCALILAHKKFYKDVNELYNNGVDVCSFSHGKIDLSHTFNILFEHAIKSHYTQEGEDWVSWFIYESDYGEKVWSGNVYAKKEDGTSKITKSDGFGAHDKDGKPIAYSILSLWNLLESDYKSKQQSY